jgi:hypothetical protein
VTAPTGSTQAGSAVGAPLAAAGVATPTTTPTGRTPVPNARKGYKLTLWVSATSETGAADVHGLLQLDGADPIPFCRLKSVQNPLLRALQEAHLAVERARARPPRMSTPSTAAAAPRPPRPTVPPTVAPTPVPPPAAPAPSDGPTSPPTPPPAQPALF